jgi:hypothetical protein
MTIWSTRLSPKTLRFCPRCTKQTTHEILENTDLAVTVCVPCVERTMSYELDRE